MRLESRRRPGVSSVVGSIFFILIMIVAIASLVSIFNSFTGYNQQVNKASGSSTQAKQTSISITSSQFGAFPPSSPSTFSGNVATTSCATTSTSYTNQGKLFYAAGMWWEFFACNSNFRYSTSFDGVTWQAATVIPNIISGYTILGPYLDVQVVGSTIYLVISSHTTLRFQLGIGTLASGGTYSNPAGTITWTSPPAEVTTGAQPTGPIEIAADTAGNEWVAVVQGTCTTAVNCAIAIYEHEACATASNTGWEPNACGSATAPTNYAPTTPNLGTLAPNANMILLSPPGALASTGAVLMYETASTAVPAGQTGTVSVITQNALAQGASTWSTMTLTGITDYSLTVSSALFIGNTMYFAGLQNAGTGQTTGALKFWTLPFTSISAATATAEQTIEGGAPAAWQAALTYSGTTLALFDNPSASTIQYYTSATLGGIWNSPAITLESAETAINGLAPASGAFAVTWANSAPNVRFAALSSFTISNSSPFGVHLVDLYAYNSAANSLVAHYLANSSNDFDYWVGQGSTMTIPVRFIWAAATDYLFTVSTDTGVTAQLTATSPPGANTACPSGSFVSQISPTTCSSGSTSPELISGAGANSCTDTTAGTALMMGLGLSYTTNAASSGSVYLSFAFQVTSPATTTITSSWQLYYGTGAGPACNAAATGTALGQSYTVKSQAAVVRGLSQSVSTTLTGLFPGTTYWFDVQASDSSAASWIYSNPDMAIVDVLSNASPLLTTSTNTNSCQHDATLNTRMMAFGTTFTTGGAGFTGNVFAKLSFNIAHTAVTTVNTKFTIAYGTGGAPGCNAAVPPAGLVGTTGNQYTVVSQAAIAGGAGEREGFVLTGLTASTTYWVDVEVVDSTAALIWSYSNPTLAVMEMPTATNSLPNVAGASNANTCNDGTVTVYLMQGFGLKYTIPASAIGDLYVTVTFQVTIPAVSGASIQWQLAYGTGAPPACGAYWNGALIGNTYIVTSQAAIAGGTPQSETFVLQNVEKLAGTTIWVDLQALDGAGAATWTFSLPSIAVATFPG